MSILIVGNILKDVYLSIDSRRDNLETDKNGTKWLDVGFDGQSYHFFHRISTFGGAAVTLEALGKLGLTASVTGVDFSFSEGGTRQSAGAEAYRYILTSEDSASYLVPSTVKPTKFQAPVEAPDFLYIDRSAEIDEGNSEEIRAFLEQNPQTKLVLYLKKVKNVAVEKLMPLATVIFAEEGAELDAVATGTVVTLGEKAVTCGDVTEKVSVARIDKMTHLSVYSIMAATILGCFIMGKTIEESLRWARLNVENSNLDASLSLAELENISNTTDEDDDLRLITAALMAPDKGILAADESGGSIKKKFAEMGIDDTFQNRHDYRNIFFTTPGINEYLTGVILFDETARDKMDDLAAIPDYLVSQRIIPGVKVDQGLKKYEGSEETTTEGLEGLTKRLRDYYAMGMRFAKWRAAFEIRIDGEGNLVTPSAKAISDNARELAEYARDAQSAGLVPIVEPEVVYDGNYDMRASAMVTGRVLDAVFSELERYGVELEAVILKTNMVMAGKKYPVQSTAEEVGQVTADVLNTHVPVALGGVVFLSGGQTPEQATENLAAVMRHGPFPWPVTFSFARALQAPALAAWAGDNGNVEAAQEAFLERLKANVEALKG